LSWSKANRAWCLQAAPPGADEARTIVVFDKTVTKVEALRFAADKLRELGGRWELTIFNKNGRIAKGDGGKRTYGGADPRRTKG